MPCQSATRPADVARAAGGHLLVGQDLVDRRAPQIPVRGRRGRAAGKLQNRLVAVVDPEFLGEGAAARAAGVEPPADEIIVGVIEVLHHLGGGPAVEGPAGGAGEPVAVVPGVLGDRRIARVQGAAGVGVDKTGGAVAVGVGLITLTAKARRTRRSFLALFAPLRWNPVFCRWQ